jgi:polysaccharide export outer membrane protein
MNENQSVSGISNRYGTLKIQPGDRLEIKIAGLESQSGLPFSFFPGQGVQGVNTESPGNTYMVDSKGITSIPVLGEIQVSNLTLEEAETLLKSKLKEVIKSPVVSIRLFNFMISVLGEVRNPGYYRVINNRINLLEALAMAGDINENGSRNKIVVWRQEAEKVVPYTIDISSNKIFLSPVFELRQNDMIYVSPNNSGLIQPTLLRTAAPLAISIASLILTTMLFFYR